MVLCPSGALRARVHRIASSKIGTALAAGRVMLHEHVGGLPMLVLERLRLGHGDETPVLVRPRHLSSGIGLATAQELLEMMRQPKQHWGPDPPGVLAPRGACR